MSISYRQVVSLFTSHEVITDKNKFPIYLRAHTTADFVVIVPYMEGSTNSLANIIMDSDLFNFWCISLFSLIITRIIIRILHPLLKTSLESLSNIPFNTAGLYFATTSAGPIRTKTEQIIVTVIAVGSIFTGTLCSGILLQTFVSNSAIPFYNSMSDLEKVQLKYQTNMFVVTNILETGVKYVGYTVLHICNLQLYYNNILSYRKRLVQVKPMRMILEIFFAKPGNIYVSVPKTHGDRLLELPHLNPNGIPVYTQLHNVKGKLNIFFCKLL